MLRGRRSYARETSLKLQENTLVFYTGICRSASTVLEAQQAAVGRGKSKQKILQAMVALAHRLKVALQKNDVDEFGEIIHENWELKRSITGQISNPQIDAWYDRARKAGAAGGKLLGAGNGGFMMFWAPRDRHEAILTELKELRPVQFGFESQGSKIIFVHD